MGNQTRHRDERKPARPGDAAQQLAAQLAELRARQHALEARLRASEARQRHYGTLFEESPVAQFVLARDGSIVQGNRQGTRLLGLGRHLEAHHHLDAFLDAESRPVLAAFLQRTFSGSRADASVTCELALQATRQHAKRIIQLEGRSDAAGCLCHAAVIDLTAVRSVEAAAQANLDLYANLNAHIPGILFQYRLDPDGSTHFPYVSASIQRMYGVTKEEAGADPACLEARVPPDDQAALEAAMRLSASSLKQWRHEYRMLLPNGEVVWRALDARPERLANGSVLWHGCTIDITERKRMEETLGQREEPWKLALEGAGDGVWEWDIAHNRVTYSSRWKEMLGYSEEEIKEQPEEWHARIHPDDLPLAEANRRRLLDGTTTLSSIEVRMLSRDGSWKWILSRGIVVARDAAGRPLRVVGTNSDITERKQMEESLRENEERWKLALEGAGHGVWEWDMASNQGLYSRRWKEILGYAEDEIGTDASEWMSRTHPDDQELIAESFRAILARERNSDSIEFRIRCKDGNWKWVLGSGILITRNDTGNTLRMVGTLSDIDARKRVEEALHTTLLELEQRRHEAERHAAAKSRFLNAASHDLRQPLYAIQLFADALDAEKLPARQREVLNHLRLSVKAMSAQLEMLLDVSRFDMGKFEPQLRDIALAAVCGDLAATYGPIAHARGVSLRFLPGSGAALHTDAVLIGRLLGNLIDNAIKFVAAGGSVLVCARRCAQGVRIEVRDNGPGIAPEHHAQIFDEYYQVGNPARNPNAGLGLGLAIAQRIAHLLDAPLTLRTAPGRGTVFAVTLATGAGPRETR